MAKKTLIPLTFLPGLYTLETDAGAKNRWKNGDKVRWLKGHVEKIGGWTKTVSAQFVGVCRSALDWISLSQAHLLMLGTHLHLQVFTGGAFFNITPLDSNGTLGSNPITTTLTSNLVTISHTAHGRNVGDYVNFSGATAVGGITIAGEYTVTSVTSVDAYVITHSAPASSGATGGGGSVGFAYEIPIGSADCAAGFGWGAGTFGSGTFGTARATSTLTALCRLWSLDNWGEDVIINPRGGGVYVWDTSTGTTDRATLIAEAPATAKATLVSMQNRHLIALGAHDGSEDDPLLIRWCSSEDYTDWTADASNSAGRKRIDAGGSEIYCGIKVGNEILVHTDQSCTSMVFSGPPYYFDFNSKGSNGALRGPAAIREYDNRAWWMGENDFFVYDGRMGLLECDVRNHVFDSINMAQRGKIFCGANRLFGEVWWLYPSANAIENDSYVLYNVRENHWSFGTLSRTIFIGDSKVFEPYGCSPDGFLYNHEVGVDDDGSAMPSSLDSWDFELGDGQYVQFLSKIIPDFKRLTGSVVATVTGKIWPQDASSTAQPAGTIMRNTPYLSPKIRARQISLGLVTSNVGDDFRIGTLRIEVRPNGKQ